MTKPYSRREDPLAFKTREFFPPLEMPNRGAPRYPWMRRYDYQCPPLDWTKRDWWRFKRAAYARGKRAATLIRELMTKVIEEYENKSER